MRAREAADVYFMIAPTERKVVWVCESFVGLFLFVSLVSVKRVEVDESCDGDGFNLKVGNQ